MKILLYYQGFCNNLIIFLTLKLNKVNLLRGALRFYFYLFQNNMTHDGNIIFGINYHHKLFTDCWCSQAKHIYMYEVHCKETVINYFIEFVLTAIPSLSKFLSYMCAILQKQIRGNLHTVTSPNSVFFINKEPKEWPSQ